MAEIMTMKKIVLGLGVPVNLTAQQSKEIFNGIVKQDKLIGSLENRCELLSEHLQSMVDNRDRRDDDFLRAAWEAECLLENIKDGKL